MAQIPKKSPSSADDLKRKNALLFFGVLERVETTIEFVQCCNYYSPQLGPTNR